MKSPENNNIFSTSDLIFTVNDVFYQGEVNSCFAEESTVSNLLNSSENQGLKLPNVGFPQNGVKLPNVGLPQNGVKLPNVGLPQNGVKLPNVGFPQNGVKLPNVGLPQNGVKFSNIKPKQGYFEAKLSDENIQTKMEYSSEDQITSPIISDNTEFSQMQSNVQVGENINQNEQVQQNPSQFEVVNQSMEVPYEFGDKAAQDKQVAPRVERVPRKKSKKLGIAVGAVVICCGAFAVGAAYKIYFIDNDQNNSEYSLTEPERVEITEKPLDTTTAMTSATEKTVATEKTIEIETETETKIKTKTQATEISAVEIIPFTEDKAREIIEIFYRSDGWRNMTCFILYEVENNLDFKTTQDVYNYIYQYLTGKAAEDFINEVSKQISDEKIEDYYKTDGGLWCWYGAGGGVYTINDFDFVNNGSTATVKVEYVFGDEDGINYDYLIYKTFTFINEGGVWKVSLVEQDTDIDTQTDTDTYNWIKVSYNGKTGYVADAFLDQNDIATDNLNMRDMPSVDANVLIIIPKGTKIIRVDNSQPVTQGGVTGNTLGNISNGGLATVQGEWIYYTGYNRNIYKISVNGSERTQLNFDNSEWLSVAENYIYYKNYDDNGYIYKINADGSGKTRVNSDNSAYINVVGDFIYYKNWSDNGYIYKIGTDGSNKTCLNNYNSSYINVVGDWIYYCNFTDNRYIYKIKTDGSGEMQLNNDSSSDVIVDGNWIYYLNDSGYIYKMRTDGSGKTLMSNERCSYLNVINDQIFYASYNGYIHKISIDGSGKTQLNSDASIYINIVGDWIYYVNSSDNDYTYKIKTDGTSRERVS